MRIPAIVLAALLAVPATAQNRVDPGALAGTWRLDLDIELEQGDNALERLAYRMASGLLDEMEIRFSFLDEGRLRVMVDAFGNKREEWSTWEITPEGWLRLGEFDAAKNADTLWYAEGDRLLPFDAEEIADGEPVKHLALVRILP